MLEATAEMMGGSHGKQKPSRQSIIVIRHGERADVVDYTWTETAARPYDPPLTERGVEQVGEVVKEFEKKVRALSACYSTNCINLGDRDYRQTLRIYIVCRISTA